MLTLPHYRILETIHPGPRVVLYRAHGEREDRSVLLKTMAGSPDPAARAALEREHEIAGELALSGVVRHLALVTLDDPRSACLVLEDLGGSTLQDALAGRPFDMPGFLAAARALARAVAELHERHVIHRALDPGTILYDVRSGLMKIADLSMASFLAREEHEPRYPGAIEGNLAYVAPEQTGRANRPVDSRADLYSLGVIFYQMLTGVVPFDAADPMGLVQCLLAEAPIPPHRRRLSTPAAIPALVLKLMAKEAEDRYQSVRGLEVDLAECARRLRAGERLDPFELGQHDATASSRTFDEVQGKQEQLAALTAAFGRAAEGRCELALIVGPSGAGKSLLAREIVRPVTEKRGYLACAECDPWSREAPLSALTRAFAHLLRQILTEPAARRESWRAALLSALDGCGEVLIDLIPEALPLLGLQPPVVALPPAEAQDRLERVVRRSLLVFAAPARPLVILIDGIQWIDPASLRLLTRLAAHAASAHLLLIGAHRGAEVAPEHPLTRATRELAERGVPVTLIHLEGASEVKAPIAAALARYPDATQDLLTLASSLGNTFDLGTLAIVAARSPRETAAGLWPALEEGLILPLDDRYQAYQWSEEDHDDAADPEAVRYRFTDDRAREAAHARIEADRRAEISLGIGRRLLEEIPPERRAARIFDIVNPLVLGADLITSPDEMVELAGLCLSAAGRAISLAATAAAVKYLTRATDLLPEGAWKSHYALMFEIHRERMECDSLAGDLANARVIFRIASKEAKTIDHLGDVHRAMIRILRTAGQTADALAIGREGLLLFGVQLPVDPAEIGAAIGEKTEEITRLIAGREVLALIDAPPLEDREIAACLGLLHECWTCAARAGNFLEVVLISLTMIALSLEHGRSELSACAYVAYAEALSIQGDHAKAHAFGALAMALARRSGSPAVIPAVHTTYATYIHHFTAHAREALPIYEEARRAALATGDRWWGARAASWARTTKLITGRPLSEVHAAGALHHDEILESGHPPLYRVLQLEQRFVLDLQGQIDSIAVPSRGRWSEEDAILASFDEHGFGWGRYWYCLLKAFLLYLYDEVGLALVWIRRAEALRDVAPNTPSYPDCFFYGALIVAASHRSALEAEQDDLLMTLRLQQETLKTWAKRCPENFRHRHLLVSAEVARVTGHGAAADRYEEAIEAARQGGYLHHQALANELCGKHYLARGQPKAARGYLMEARTLYTQWGASAKVALLDERHGELCGAPEPAAPAPPPSGEVSRAELEKKEEELAASLNELKDVQDRMLVQSRLAFLGSLTAGIAHDLRNPLTFITNFAELSIELADEIGVELTKVRTRLDDDTAVYLDELRTDLKANLAKVTQHGGRAARVIRSMLEQYRESAGAREEVDLNALLREYVELAFQGRRLSDPSFDIVVELDFDESIGPVSMVPQEMSRVFLNLIDNAGYAASVRKRAPGQRDHTPRVLVKTRDLGRRLEVRIRDNGLGVPDTIRDRIFDPFFTTKPVGEGTGLGLSISYEIVVQRNGGTLRLESEEGQYTELIVTLPKRWIPARAVVERRALGGNRVSCRGPRGEWMTIGEFRLERWFAAWEFTARHLLSASDCETMSIGELLETAGAPASQLLDLRLGYSHSQGEPALRAAIARFYSAHSADDILVTNAPEEAIFLTMQALLRAGDRVVVQTPCYQSLSELAVHRGCDVHPWPLVETATSWRMDLDHLADLMIDGTRLLVINTPHNPTGHLPSITEFETILGLCAERGIWLLCDEMYRGLEHQRSSRLPAASQRYERAISLWGMSKSFGLPGLRIGWLALQDREVLESMVRVKDYTTICSSGPGQLLARIALERTGVLMAKNLEIIQANLSRIREFMARFREVFAWREPMGGSVAFARLRSGGAKAFCEAAVEEQGILLVPSTVFDFGDSHIRWGMGRRSFADGLTALEAHMKGRASIHRLSSPP